MTTFLEHVADDILAKYGSNLSRIAVVFPNKRASLFLNEYLARRAGQPLWSPAYITISDLFRQHSARSVADPVKLVCDLHRSFTAQTGIDETLDHFYSWGQLLLSDFDDIDKNMADADRVFANLKDIHELDDVSYLSDDQKAALQRFFSHFSPDHNSILKERFLRLWSRIDAIYHDFNSRLADQGLAYEGALYREVATRTDLTFPYDTYLFVGFNMVQRVEQQLFTLLRQQGKARFYWDFDHYYLHDNEAGHFILQYLDRFPNELDTSDNTVYDIFRQPKTINIVSAPTNNIQARFIRQWLSEGTRAADGRQTVIVLCDEQLLPTAIHSLPSAVSKVNITTGYPLAHTPVASLIMSLLNLRILGYDHRRQRFMTRFVNIVMRHPYIAILHHDVSSLLFRPLTPAAPATATAVTPLLLWLLDILKLVATESHDSDPLFQESVFRAYTLVNRLHALADSGDLAVDATTLQRLVGQLLQTASVPFHGEPAEGLQLMGVLETRNLDFAHVLLLSCNEGNMPRGISDTSFIPYSIRRAYGLTTVDHKSALYSYYFHSLLQRAADVTIVYNNATTDGNKGELSRYVLQLMAEGPHPVRHITLRAGQHHTPLLPPTIDKTPSILQSLISHFSTDGLSPTAINRYLRCPLLFYYNYACHLHEPDQTDDQTIDNRIFGNIFHEASRLLYSQLTERNPRILKADIDRLLHTKGVIERAVDSAFITEFFRNQQPGSASQPQKLPELSGLQIISREVIIHYVRQLLHTDALLAPFTILKLEDDVHEPITITAGDTTFSTVIGGRVDRMDLVTDSRGDRIRVVDYKTGAYRLRPLADVDAVFLNENIQHHSDYYLQAILYADIVSRQQHADAARQPLPVSPALLFIQHAAAPGYDPTLAFGKTPIRDVADISQPFNAALHTLIAQIFDPKTPFTPTADSQRCLNCPFFDLCAAKTTAGVKHPATNGNQ